MCGCGCGFWESETHGEDNEGWFVAEEDICWARHAIDEKVGEHKTPPPGVLVWVRRATEDDD